jgi:DNA repair exonuclease SbcCD ATPase subunit
MMIAHLSDIHIRKTRRHEEYKVVLDNLVASLESLPIDRIVLAGDLLHNKTDLSPEAVQLASEYLDRLSDIAPIDLILGNHDCVINQHNRLDSLTPIISLLKSNGKPITLYEESGLYDVTDDLVYGIFAQQETKHQWPIDINREDGKKYVALYHGAIDGSRTSGSYRIDSDIDKSIFRNYDFGMLGDIHSRQPMILDDNGKIKVAYAGSLIQQNFGEEIEKGFLLWDLDQKKCMFIEVANDWGFKTFRLDQDAINNIENIEFDLPTKPYVRILLNTSDYNVTTAKHVESVIKNKYKPEGLFIEVDVQSTVDDLSLSGKTENVTDLKTQQDLLKQYFAKRPTISEQEVNEIISIHKDFYDTCSTEEYDTYKGRKWVIHKVLFDNVFSYGPSNIINFDKMKGLTGIFSANASGKSSILYTILQGFFNNSNRTGGRNVADVIHKNQNEGSIEIEFSIDDQKYVIERTFKRNKRNPNRANNKVELYQIVHGDKINVSGEANVRETEATIRSLLGSYEEHTMTTFSQQFDITRFIDHGQTNRKDLLARFLGLNVIDDLQKSIKEETSSIRTILREYQQNDYPSILSQYEERLKKTADKIKVLNEEKQILEDDVSKNKKVKEGLVKSLHPTYGGLRPIISIEKDISKSNKSIEKLEESWETNQKLKVDLMSRHQRMVYELFNITKKGIFEDRKNIYYNTIESQKNLKSEYDLRNQIVNTYEKQSVILNKHDWFETNETCKKCSFLTSAFGARSQLVEEKKWIEDALIEKNRLHEELNKHSDFPQDEKQYQKCRKEKSEIESKLENLEIVFENIKLQLELERNKLTSYKGEEKTYKKNENSIKHNTTIGLKIKSVDSKIAETDIKFNNNNNEHTKESSNLGALSQKIMDLDGNIEVLKEIEKKYSTHQLLMDAFGSDGIPLMIMNKAVPLINNEIRKVLSNITNFEVSLEVDTEAHDLSIFIDDGTSRRRVELGSGMEKTLTALTIRSALSNISLLPTCNLFVIDEGFGTLDSENINHMNQLLLYLKSKFENVLIISHIESMQDITNNVLSIHKNERGYSSIKIL